MNRAIRKYPRTHHIEGSRLQPGDEDLSSVSLEELRGEQLVVEEKLDGANAGISFDDDGSLLLQSRGHYLTGGHRERHFNLLKTWAQTHRSELWRILGSRFLLYGEWLYAKHTVFYDQLPHYFLEFDVLDRQDGHFLSTERRRDMFTQSPIASVPVLWRGPTPTRGNLENLVTKSSYKSDGWKKRLVDAAVSQNLDSKRVQDETDSSDDMEGLYIKVERKGRVVARYKFVRATFLTSVVDSGSHWLDRPILPNQLAPNVNIFAQGDP